jgi:hypothetical protein
VSNEFWTSLIRNGGIGGGILRLRTCIDDAGLV